MTFIIIPAKSQNETNEPLNRVSIYSLRDRLVSTGSGLRARDITSMFNFLIAKGPIEFFLKLYTFKTKRWNDCIYVHITLFLLESAS